MKETWRDTISYLVESYVSVRMEDDFNRGKQKSELFYYGVLIRAARRKGKVIPKIKRVGFSTQMFLVWWRKEKKRIIRQRREKVGSP